MTLSAGMLNTCILKPVKLGVESTVTVEEQALLCSTKELTVYPY